MAYCAIEPFGQEWLQSGTVAAAVVNMQRDQKKSTAVEATDFIPGYRKPMPGREVVAGKVEAYFMALAAAPGNKERV